MEYNDGYIYIKYSMGDKTGRIYFWNHSYLTDGPFDTLLLLQSSEVTENDTFNRYLKLGISRCLQVLFWIFWSMDKPLIFYGIACWSHGCLLGAYVQLPVQHRKVYIQKLIASCIFSLTYCARAGTCKSVLEEQEFTAESECKDYVHDINVTDIVPGTNGSNKVICPSAAGDHPPQNGSMVFSSGNSTGFELFEEWWNKSQTVPFYLIAILLPLLNLKSPSFFAKFNVLGTVSVIYLILLVTVKAAHLGIHLEYNWFTEDEFFVPEFRILFPQLTGVLTLAFFIHNCVITLLQNNKNQENNVRDLSIAYLLVGLTYLYVGVIIFASFPSPPLSKECIEQNFLDNFPSNDIMSFIARIFLLFQMMTVYPLLGYLARVQLLRQLFGNAYPSVFHVLILNIAIVGAGVLMARFYPNIGGIIRYSGATCGLAFVFVYPSLIYVISLHRAGQLTWPVLIIHIFIIVLGLANLIAQFLL
uniref:Neutral amino acid transporter 9 n=1 Tax=Anas platyrhynchos platyrhynchos TaxID=8840 RepID=A0A493TLQ8_ANAPP